MTIAKLSWKLDELSCSLIIMFLTEFLRFYRYYCLQLNFTLYISFSCLYVWRLMISILQDPAKVCHVVRYIHFGLVHVVQAHAGRTKRLPSFEGRRRRNSGRRREQGRAHQAYRKRWVSTGRNIHALVKLNTSEKVRCEPPRGYLNRSKATIFVGEFFSPTV